MEPLNYNHTAQEFWNYGDLNRVNDWTLYIKNQLGTLGYNASITSRTWKAGDYPTPNKLATIRNNINALKSVWFTPEGWRELKKLPAMMVEKPLTLNRSMRKNGICIYWHPHWMV